MVYFKCMLIYHTLRVWGWLQIQWQLMDFFGQQLVRELGGEQRGGWSWGVTPILSWMVVSGCLGFVGDDISYPVILRDYFINHEIRIPIKQPGFKYFLCSPLFGEDSQFDEHIFSIGWFNHQPVSNHQLNKTKTHIFIPPGTHPVPEIDTPPSPPQKKNTSGQLRGKVPWKPTVKFWVDESMNFMIRKKKHEMRNTNVPGST